MNRSRVMLALLGCCLALAVLNAVTASGTARVLSIGAAVVALGAVLLVLLRDRR